MVTLHGYILRDLLKTFSLALVGLTALFTLGGALYNVIRLEGVTAGDVVFALPVLIPLMVTLAMPLSALFAAALTYGRLAADNELTACRAAGINIHRLFLSATLLAVFVTLFMTVSVNYVMPRIYKEIDRYTRSNIRDFVFMQLRQRGYVHRGGERSAQHLLTAQSVRPVEERELVQRGFERPTAKLAYFWIEEPRYLWVDAAGNLSRFISADGALAQFDTRQDKVLVTVYIREGNDYEVGKRAARLREQPIGPIELPIEFPLKTSMVDLNTLLAWRAQPWTPPDVAKAAEGYLDRLRIRTFAQQAIERLAGGGALELSGADGRTATITARECVAGDRGVAVRDAVVRLVDASHPRGIEYRAVEGRITARRLGDNDSLVEVRLTGVEEHLTPDPGRRGRPDPPRRREEVFIDGLRIPDSVLAATADLGPRDVVNPAWRPPHGQDLDDARASVLKTAASVGRKVTSNLHFRLGTAVSTIVTVLMAAIIGVMLRGSRALVAIGVAAVVVIAVFLVIAMGKTLTENARTTHAGPLVIWGVIVATGVANVALLRLGVRR